MRMKLIAAVLGTVLSLALCGCFGPGDFPAGTPEIWRDTPLLANTSHEIMPGVVCYSWHFEKNPEPSLIPEPPLSLHAVVVDWDAADVVRMREKLPEGIKPLVRIATDASLPENQPGAYVLTWRAAECPEIQLQSAMDKTKDRILFRGLLLAQNGKSRFSRDVQGRDAYAAVGINPDTHRLVLLTVDGGHEKVPGVRFSDLPELMFALGAKDVLMLHSGGGVELSVADDSGELRVVNCPAGNKQFDHAGAIPSPGALYLLKAGK